MTRDEILDRMIEDARGTGMSPVEKLVADWDAGAAEREHMRAKVHAHFDAVRDRANAERWARDGEE